MMKYDNTLTFFLQILAPSSATLWLSLLHGSMKSVEVSGMQMLTMKPWERLRMKEMNPRSISSASITIEPY